MEDYVGSLIEAPSRVVSPRSPWYKGWLDGAFAIGYTTNQLGSPFLRSGKK